MKHSNVSLSSIVECEVSDDATPVQPFELSDLPETEITESELQVIFYVAGYCAHNLRKRISCMRCKSLIISDSNLPSVDEPTKFFEILNRGGLKCPANEIFLLCCTDYEVFCRIKCSSNFEQFLRLQSPRDTIVSTVLNCVEENDAIEKACPLNHMLSTWQKVLTAFFNCLARNFLRSYSSGVNVDDTSRKIYKLCDLRRNNVLSLFMLKDLSFFIYFCSHIIVS